MRAISITRDDLEITYRSSQNYYRQSCYSGELFPRNYRYRYRLEIRMNSFNYHCRYRHGVPSFPLIPNYRLESHLNLFPQNYRYRYRLVMFSN